MAEIQTENYNIQNNEGQQYLKNDFDDTQSAAVTESRKTVYGHERNKFKGFGEYTNQILKDNEKRINELVEMTKLEYPQTDNWFIWLCACDFVMEELGIKNESDLGKSLYEDFLKERQTTLYNSVQLSEESIPEQLGN